jgi:NAD(P)-dependent dehydrogenase (short-subunit alcohol dehydrogenase family)
MSDPLPSFVVVGATGGIGSEVCRRLAGRGANLFLAARDAGRLQALAAELSASNPAARFITKSLDATKPADVDAAFAAAVEAFGRIDGATHLVGSILLKPAHLTTDDEFEQTLTLNLRSAFYVLRAATKAMTSTGGSIVLASTVATQIGLTNHEAIAAAKGGINGLVLSAAASYAGRNIRVNAVAPGLVRTPLAAKITGNDLALKASTAMHPLGRIGEPADVAAAVTFLLDPANSWITGQIVGVDGGLGRVRGR